MARDLTAYGVHVTQVIILPTGASALLMNPIDGEISSLIKYVSGGSLEIRHADPGSTNTITAGLGYIMGTNEVLNFDGAVRYYLCATGATTVAYILKGLSMGY